MVETENAGNYCEPSERATEIRKKIHLGGNLKFFGYGGWPVYQAVIGTALAGDTHSLARRTNPPAASSVPWHGVA